MDIRFRQYSASDKPACMEIFDANCPEYFAVNEREDYESFLGTVREGYEVCEAEGQVLGAFGLMPNADGDMRLVWILLDPRSQGAGIGGKIMERVLQLAQSAKADSVGIAASHKSAPFFARFGAIELSTTADGWGPGMHRVDMTLPVE